MTPGEILTPDGEIELNAGRPTLTLAVANRGDRPIQVGSHYHFHEVNEALAFDRAAARGFRLDIAAGTAVRFEPGQTRTVRLVALGGARVVFGFAGAVMGALDATRGRGAAKKTTVRGAAAKKAKGAAMRESPAARSGTKGGRTGGVAPKRGATKGRQVPGRRG